MRRGRSANRRPILLWVLSLTVVASMICSFVIMLRPPREPSPTSTPRPTLTLPTATPSLEETLVSPATAAPPPTRMPSPAAEILPTSSPTPTGEAAAAMSSDGDHPVLAGSVFGPVG